MRVVVAILAMFLPIVTVAEPSPVVRHLMNEPVSSLDFGLYLFEERMQRDSLTLPSLPAPAGLQATALYGWDTNRIYLMLQIDMNTSILTARNVCREAINYARTVNGVNPTNGRLYGDGSGYNPSIHFKSGSFTKESRPKDFEAQVLSLIEIRMQVMRRDVRHDGTWLVVAADCRGALMSTDVLFKED